MSSIKATLFISFLFHILLCIFLCYQAFWNLRKLSSHIWLLAETMATLFLFLLNLHVCHLLDCLFFYKISCNWYSVPYIYSALEFLKQFQPFCFQDCVLPLYPIHTHPLWEKFLQCIIVISFLMPTFSLQTFHSNFRYHTHLWDLLSVDASR